MQRYFVLFSWLLILPVFLKAGNTPPAGQCEFVIDLAQVQGDFITVEVRCPTFNVDEIDYSLPKIVPGTYSIDDYGHYVSSFAAFDNEGRPLEVTHPDVNTWTIKQARRLSKITYRVDDSYDDPEKGSGIFEPTGSNIQRDTNYVINNHAFAGYFKGHQQMSQRLTIRHRADFYGSTPMHDLDPSATNDVFETVSYNELVDNPLMYCRPDTASVQVGNTQVLLSVYSPRGWVKAAYLIGKLDTLLQAAGKYLGGKLPVDKYAFLVYFSTKPGLSGGEGALEHSHGSMYFFQERPEDVTAPFFVDIAAHEFFHILTPLNMHSEEIHYFDFNSPKMSKHLWLYEGTTEYHSHIMQVKYGLKSREAYLQQVRNKINFSRSNFIDTLAFTEMSANCLDKYVNQYTNVYVKGDLIGMCLDIVLLSNSDGKYGLLDLIKDMSKQYGKNQPFKDDELFGIIGRLGGPAAQLFLEKYVGGPTPLPFTELFARVGVKYQSEKSVMEFNMGSIGMTARDTQLAIVSLDNMNAFGQTMGYKVGDVIQKINDRKISISNFNAWKNEWLQTVKTGDRFTVEVLRPNSKGKLKKKKLSAPIFQVENKVNNLLSFDPDADPVQLRLREAWLGAR